MSLRSDSPTGLATRWRQLNQVGTVRTVRAVVDPLLLLAVIILLVEVAVNVFDVSELLLPAPSSIFETLVDEQARFVRTSVPTATFIVLSFLGSGAFGIFAAVVLFLSSRLYRTFYPLLVFVFVLPKITLAPLLLLWFGAGNAYYLSIGFVFVFFPVLENTLTGLRGVPDELMELSALYQASRWFRFRNVQLPSSLPHIGAGLKIGFTRSTVAIVLAEIVAPVQGLGALLMYGEAYSNPELVFATVVVIGLLAMALFKVLEVSLDRLVFWRDLEGSLG